jgi:hypothetical protein
MELAASHGAKARVNLERAEESSNFNDLKTIPRQGRQRQSGTYDLRSMTGTVM